MDDETREDRLEQVEAERGEDLELPEDEAADVVGGNGPHPRSPVHGPYPSGPTQQ